MTVAQRNGSANTERPAAENRIAQPARKSLLDAFAIKKKLPIEFLKKHGLSERNFGKEIAIQYRDCAGNDVFARVRTTIEAGKGFRNPPGQVPECAFLSERIQAARDLRTLYIAESESDALTMVFQGMPTIAVPGAAMASKLPGEVLELIDRVYLIRHNDQGGGAMFVAEMTKRLKRLNFGGQVLQVSAPHGFKDPSDLHVDNPDAEKFRWRWDQQVKIAKLLDVQPKPAEREPKPERPNPGTILMELAFDAGIKLFHDRDRTPYATITVNGHEENHALAGRMFASWLVNLHLKKTGKAMGDKAVTSAVSAMSARAIFDEPMFETHLRVASENGKVYLDLGDRDYNAIEISASGWKLQAGAPVKFIRSANMRPLPCPDNRGHAAQLKEFLNVKTDGDWALLLPWLLSMFYPDGPKALLLLFGEQGSAKTTAARILRSLIDPAIADVCRPPKDDQQLLVNAKNSWIVAFDNLSSIPGWLSDALCCLSTGTGGAYRQLYTDSDQVVFHGRRGVILTAIENLIQRGDLLSRTVPIELEPIAESDRRPEKKILAEFEALRPAILGGLLHALADALRRLPGVDEPRLPRLADFAQLGIAAEPSLGIEAGQFLRSYRSTLATDSRALAEDHPLWTPIRKLLDLHDGAWSGSPRELLAALRDQAPRELLESRQWPADARHLSAVLRRLAPDLRNAGIAVERTKGAARCISLYARATESSGG